MLHQLTTHWDLSLVSSPMEASRASGWELQAPSGLSHCMVVTGCCVSSWDDSGAEDQC